MPIYEFECGQCGAGFERLQKLSDPDPEQCPACQAAGSIRRRVSAPSFRLAGSGWYETDFKSDKDRKRNLAGGESSAGASEGGTGAGTGGDSKPAAANAGTTSTSGAAPSTAAAPSTSSGTT